MFIQASIELDVSLLERCPHFSVAGFNGVGTFLLERHPHVC